MKNPAKSVPIYRCPKSRSPPAVTQWVSFYGPWSNGTMAVAGGLLDQTPAYVQAMRILDFASQEAEREQRERAEESRGK